MPSRALTSGRKFSTTTSAFSTSRRNTSRPFLSFRLSVIARLLRCKFWKSDPWRGPPGCSPAASSIRASILITLAPQSASCRTQVGPERTRVRSSTVKRDRAWEARGKGIRGGLLGSTETLQLRIQSLRFQYLTGIQFSKLQLLRVYLSTCRKEVHWLALHSEIPRKRAAASKRSS